MVLDTDKQLTNDGGLVVHAKPDTSYLHLIWWDNNLDSLREEWSSTVILNQGMIVVETWFTNAWLNTTL